MVFERMSAQNIHVLRSFASSELEDLVLTAPFDLKECTTNLFLGQPMAHGAVAW